MEVEHRKNSYASFDSNEDILLKKAHHMELEEENGASTELSKSEKVHQDTTEDESPFSTRRIDELDEIQYLKEAKRKKSDSDTRSTNSEDNVQKLLLELSEASKTFFNETIHEWTIDLIDGELDQVVVDAKIFSVKEKFSALKTELEMEVIPANDMAALKKVLAICEWMSEVCRKYIFKEKAGTWTFRRLCYIVQKMKELGIPEGSGIGRHLTELHQKGSSIIYDYEIHYEEKRKEAALKRESLIPEEEAKRMLEELENLRGSMPVEEQIRQISNDLANVKCWEDKLKQRIDQFADRLVYQTMRTTPYQTPDKSLDDRVSASQGIENAEVEVLRLRKEFGQTVIKSLRYEEFAKKSEWLFSVSNLLKKMIKDVVGEDETKSVRAEGKNLQKMYQLGESEKALIKYLGEEMPVRKEEKIIRIESSPESIKSRPASVKKEKEIWERDGFKSDLFERSARKARLMEQEKNGKTSKNRGEFISNMDIVKKDDFPFDHLDDIDRRLNRMLSEIRSESSKSPFRYKKARSEVFGERRNFSPFSDRDRDRDYSYGGAKSAYVGSPWRKPKAATGYGSDIKKKYSPERDNYTRRPYRDTMVTYNLGKLRNDSDEKKKHTSIKKMLSKYTSPNSRLSRGRSVLRDDESETFSDNGNESRWQKNLPVPEIVLSARKLEPSPRRWHDQEADSTVPLYNPDYAGRTSERKRKFSEINEIPRGTVLKIFDGVLKCGASEDTRCPKMSLFTCSKHDIVTSIPQLTEECHKTLKATGRFAEDRFEAYFANILDNEVKDQKVIAGWIDSHIIFYQNHLNHMARELLDSKKIGICPYNESAKLFLLHKQQMKSNWKRALNFEIKKTQRNSNPSLYFIIVHKPYKLEFATKSIAPEIVPVYDESDDTLSVQLESLRETQRQNRELGWEQERSPTLSFKDSDFGVAEMEDSSNNLWEPERRPATPLKSKTLPAKKLETISSPSSSLNGKRNWEELSSERAVINKYTGDPKKRVKCAVAAFREEEEDQYEEDSYGGDDNGEEIEGEEGYVNPLMNVLKRMNRTEMIETLMDMDKQEIVEVAKEMDKDTRESVIQVLLHMSSHKKKRNRNRRNRKNRRFYNSPRYVKNLNNSFSNQNFQTSMNFAGVQDSVTKNTFRPVNPMNNQDFQLDNSFSVNNYGYNNSTQGNWNQYSRSPQKNRNPYFYNNVNQFTEEVDDVDELDPNMLDELGFMFDGNSIVMRKDAYEGITQIQELMGLPTADPREVRQSQSNRPHFNKKQWRNKRFY